MAVGSQTNNPITEEEIQKVINNLKSKKSPGIDNLLNEYFISLRIFLYLCCHVYLMLCLIAGIFIKLVGRYNNSII